MFTPPTYHLCNFWKAIKMPTCTHTGRFISVPLYSGQSELASICLFVQFNNQLEFLMHRTVKTRHQETRLLKSGCPVSYEQTKEN